MGGRHILHPPIGRHLEEFFTNWLKDVKGAAPPRAFFRFVCREGRKKEKEKTNGKIVILKRSVALELSETANTCAYSETRSLVQRDRV